LQKSPYKRADILQKRPIILRTGFSDVYLCRHGAGFPGVEEREKERETERRKGREREKEREREREREKERERVCVTLWSAKESK